MGLAFDFIQDGIYLECVVALNVLEAVGPCGQVGPWVADGRAGRAFRGADARQSNDVGVDFRSIEIVQRTRSCGSSHGRVGGMLVRPCGVTACGMDYAEDGV